MNENYYNLEYLPKMHRIGKVIGVLAVFASFMPALALGLVYGLWPNWAALGTAALTAISFFGVLWFVEPLSYYPVVGPMGTYMAFVSGNISNMRIPCASMAQVSAGVEPGTDKGSIIVTIGMGVSIVINTLVLSVGVIAGQAILSALPAAVNNALANYLLPALFGALIVQFGMKAKGHTVLMLPGLSQKRNTVERVPLVPGAPGHGCGHNLIGSASATAAVALKNIMQKEGLAGTIRFYGCPEEELLSGKVKMAYYGMFEGCDLAISWHPMTGNAVLDNSYLACAYAKFYFTGTTSHAAFAPHLGRSALDAMELMNVGVNYLREHVIDSARIHYATDSCGYPPQHRSRQGCKLVLHPGSQDVRCPFHSEPY